MCCSRLRAVWMNVQLGMVKREVEPTGVECDGRRLTDMARKHCAQNITCLVVYTFSHHNNHFHCA